MLYAVQNDALYAVDPYDGSWDEIPGHYAGTTHIAWAGGALMVIQNDLLYRTDPVTGDYTELPSSYAGTTAAAGSSRYFFVIQGDTLYRVDPVSGDYESLGGGYQGPRKWPRTTTSSTAYGRDPYGRPMWYPEAMRALVPAGTAPPPSVS